MQYEWDSEKRLTHGFLQKSFAHITPRLISGERRFVALGYLGERLHLVV